ncbi:ATP-binding protein [Acidimicrobiia bacterium EGI L10123]|uniref:sensor histidine kinase n=1 Tax=Salinilacustrithrix flava TaxID=2957203 RepID=UPI003D7C1DB2|nr:ATP-binding protein [Acidimicrobiia bacterium EGI L10123]
MANRFPDPHQRGALLQGATAVLAVVAVVVALVQGAVLTAAVAAVVAALVGLEVRRRGQVTLTAPELDRLREAELALARATDTHEAARELAEHAIALLGARSAVVLIEGIGDTVRVAAGPTATEDVYGSGSRMRLLDDAGLPCGSIAVSARADGRPYAARHERILDALAERVSTTLHQLSLLTDVSTERRTLADLVGSSSDGIFSVASDLRVRAWNPAMEAITGVPADLAVGEHVSQSFRPTAENGEPATGSADPGRAGRPVTGVVLQIEAGGEERWLTCSYAPLSDGGYVAVARDETARKKLQDDKDGWIAQVSHELRTPLTPIKGFLHTLARRDAELTTEDRARIYEIMIREEHRLEALVDSLLRSTQLDASGMVVERTEVDWADRVLEQVELVRRQDPSRTITLDVDPDAGPVLADEGLAVGVLTNLLSNALKYAEGDGAVEVVVEADGDELITSVIDHGPGIPRSDRTRVFDKFTRLGNHLTRAQQGVGLGLHIAKQSIERLDGRIWVDETPGGGATFRFTLPRTERSRRRSPLRAPGSPRTRS